MNTNIKVLYSVFKRNFFGYLSNPTGYVFICVFVLLSSIAAFLPDEFFNANLANLDQLNLWFPLIMLVFVPAITMSIWADERRQGTDELLLTIPAGDFDIVLGKFKAAVCIYTVSLLFSLICSLAILRYLGTPDIGLFLCTYLGYWLVGVTMISMGMVASFLTGNLTVAYILGAVFCSPLIALNWIDAAPVTAETAQLLKSFSLAAQFELFGRGLVNFSSLVYFAMITATMLYLCVVLIGRRHWTAQRKSVGTLHYTLRTVALLTIGLSLCFLFQQHDLRADLTEERLSTLSPETRKLLQQIKPEYPVVIEAFLSPTLDMPESHIQTRLDIVSILGEIESICGKNVQVRIFPTQPNTERALIANQRYDIKPQDISFASRGKREFKSLFMGVAFRSGLSTLSLPFIDRGLSVEYELVHALCSITTPRKKRIGIVKTDAPLMGQLDMSSFQMLPQWQIVDELKKQYTVVEVDPVEPIKEKFDALLAVQPSQMGPAELTNFIEAVKTGQPTEDPMPVYVRGVAGTGEPRQAPSQMMLMMGQQQPKGDISPLWDLLGVQIEATRVVWQDYYPIRKLAQIPEGFVFLDKSFDNSNDTSASPFNTADPVTSALQYLMLPLPGRIVTTSAQPSDVTALLHTFQTPQGYVETRDAMQSFRSGVKRGFVAESVAQNMAVRIRRAVEESTVDVLLVSDIDMLSDMLFTLRRAGNEPGSGINLNFDNVTFVLNAIDSVAGDERFLTVRTRRPKHRTLSKFDENTDKIRSAAHETRQALQADFDATIKAEEDKLQAEMKTLQDGLQGGSVNEEEAMVKFTTAMMTAQKRLAAAREKQQRELNIQLEKSNVELNENIQHIQGRYKLAAVALPPLPPLLIGIAVLVFRKIRETEGIPQTRRKK